MRGVECRLLFRRWFHAPTVSRAGFPHHRFGGRRLGWRRERMGSAELYLPACRAGRTRTRTQTGSASWPARGYQPLVPARYRRSRVLGQAARFSPRRMGPDPQRIRLAASQRPPGRRARTLVRTAQRPRCSDQRESAALSLSHRRSSGKARPADGAGSAAYR